MSPRRRHQPAPSFIANGTLPYDVKNAFTSLMSNTLADMQAQTMMSSRMAGEKANPAALMKVSASVRESLSASAS